MYILVVRILRIARSGLGKWRRETCISNLSYSTRRGSTRSNLRKSPLNIFPASLRVVAVKLSFWYTSRVPGPNLSPYISPAVCSLSLLYTCHLTGLWIYSYRLTHASVLLSYIDSVSVATIIYYALGLFDNPFALPCRISPYRADHASQELL